MWITPDDLLLERIYRWERERADRIFLTQPFGGGQVRHWTWAQAIGEARRMAAYLQSQNWDYGSRIAILSKNCAWWIMADIAIWMAGHVTVPVYPSLRSQSVRQILEHCGARACFVGALDEPETSGVDRLPGMMWIAFPSANHATGKAWETLVTANAPLAGFPTRKEDELATVIYTSGTTGAPKGVMHRFGALAYNAKVLTATLGLVKPQRAFSYLPLAHIVERVGVEATAFRLGSYLFFTEGIETFVADLRRARPTLFISVPRLLLKFQQKVLTTVDRNKLDWLLRIPAVNLYVKHRILGQLGLSSVKMAASGAAPLPTEILRWFRDLGLQLGEGYGLTETLITHLPTANHFREGYVGCALPGVETRVSEQGALLVRSPMNMMGYYRDPELTHAAFTPDGFFRTGDLVVLEPDGQLKIIGRLKEQFKTSKGKYVTPAPIESRLMEHPAIEACCLMGAGQPSPLAIVVLSAADRQRCADPRIRQALEDSLLARMEAINRELDPFERLSLMVIAATPWTIGNGLLTPTLKVRRAAIEDQYQQRIEKWRAQNRPIVWEP